MEIRMAFEMLEPEYGLTEMEINYLINQLPYYEFVPVVIESDSYYAIGFIENEAYTGYLERKYTVDSQIRQILNDWDNRNETNIYCFDSDLDLPEIIGDGFILF